jgi:hypothetical protein
MATIFQQPKETAQQSLLRALDLRNKAGFASKESDCEVRYDESLIHKTFIKSFETSLREMFSQPVYDKFFVHPR